jgi:hypothetical protein
MFFIKQDFDRDVYLIKRNNFYGGVELVGIDGEWNPDRDSVGVCYGPWSCISGYEAIMNNSRILMGVAMIAGPEENYHPKLDRMNFIFAFISTFCRFL